MSEIYRGQVYLAKHPDLEDKKYFLVVSNNKRNRNLNTVLCVRITSTSKAGIPTCVPIPNHDGLTGYIVCDDVYMFMDYELEHPTTSFTDKIMVEVERALKLVFSIRD